MLQKTFYLITPHSPAIIAAVILALLVISPAILFPFMAGESYRGINIGNYGDDDFGYLAKGRDFLDGHPPGNFVLKEGKGNPDPHRIYVEYVLLAPLRLFGMASSIDIAALYTLYNFLGVFVLVLLIYFWVLRISNDKALALLIALFTVGGYTFVILHPTRISPFTSDFNIYGRPIMPVFGSVGFFVFLDLLTRSLQSLRWKHAVYAGVSFGALFYIYFYAWSFALAVAGSLIVVCIFCKRWKQAKLVFVATVIGLSIGSYLITELISFSQSGTGGFFMAIENTRAPLPLSKLLVLTSALFMVYVFKKRDDKNLVLLLSLILASWAALNQQMITGKMLQSLAHYWPYFVIPMCIIVGLYLLWNLVSNATARKVIVIVSITLVFANTAIRQFRGTLTTLPVKQYAQQYRPIIDAVTREPQLPGVILASDWFYGKLFIVYTPHDLFWSSQAFVLGASIQRIVDALLVYAYLSTEARDNLADYIVTPRKDDFIIDNYFSLERYWLGMNIVEYSYRVSINDPYILNKRSEFISYLSREFKTLVDHPQEVSNLLKKYGVTYIVWDANRNPHFDAGSSGVVKELARHNGIYLYQLMN